MTRHALAAGLRQRHLAMIALGGAIGAGLFVGSGIGIAAAGPGILVSYLLAGALTMLVMRMLGEMSAARPVTGSFAEHARRAFGPWAGVLSGWMYWALLVVSVAAEALGAAHIVSGWIPAVPDWAWVAVFMSVFTLSNLAGVRNFGELEFWFAGLKIAAICGFLAIGGAALAGLLPGHASPGTSHLIGDGGFLPHGWHGVAVGMVAAVFAFGGLETVTIAAAECEDPVKAVRTGVRAVMWRVSVCYIGSMAVIVALVPWNAPDLVEGPYAAAMQRVGVAGAADLMKAVVLVALLSAMNANIYGSSRMLYALVGRGDAPRALGRLGRGVPYAAVLASAAFGFGSVVLSLVWPATVFPFLLNSIGAAILVVWALIAASHLRLHGASVRAVTVLASIGGVLLFMLGDAVSRTQILTTGAWTAALLGWAWCRRLRNARNGQGRDPLPN
ncbi:amino acid permease [Streptomyces sp. VRA16 Mangrove soil]|uniref:amino acid permease n=1 Tax=Streptomyces sp. VRA16 Mangrove soil TaxID=2817434 RepID=UPI001A9FB84E|nr:amino acid permease [Streptomyces sp. VRA16 Mangrove soil]MBO1331379.1 amino acid permease [Streptomyces sp. VRA16 Mangrove soil]